MSDRIITQLKYIIIMRVDIMHKKVFFSGEVEGAFASHRKLNEQMRCTDIKNKWQ